MKLWNGAVLAVALAFVGCGAADDGAPETPATQPVETVTVTATPEAEAEPEPSIEASESPDESIPTPSPVLGDPEEDFMLNLAVTGVGTEPASEDELISAGWAACEALDAGSEYRLAAAFTVLELPEGVPDDLPYAVATAAAYSLCPEHWEQVYTESQD